MGKFAVSAEIAGVAEDADLCVRAARALQDRDRLCLGRGHPRAQAHPHGRRSGGRKLGCGDLSGRAQPSVANSLAARRTLAALGLELGADVPVFVRGRAAWAEGVGERLTPLYAPLAPIEANYLILKPNV